MLSTKHNEICPVLQIQVLFVFPLFVFVFLVFPFLWFFFFSSFFFPLSPFSRFSFMVLLSLWFSLVYLLFWVWFLFFFHFFWQQMPFDFLKGEKRTSSLFSKRSVSFHFCWVEFCVIYSITILFSFGYFFLLISSRAFWI